MLMTSCFVCATLNLGRKKSTGTEPLVINLCGSGGGQWLSSWLAEQEVRGSIPHLATLISEIGYLRLPSRDMAEIPLKRRKSSIQRTNQPTNQLIYAII